jgi:hypothetical protein
MRWLVLLIVATLCWACETEVEPDGRNEQVGYRTGTSADDYQSNGERGNVAITEIHWAGSVRNDTGQYDPKDVFIELQNKHPRPIHLTGWILTIETGFHTEGLHHVPRSERSSVSYVLPRRLSGQPVETNGYLVVASRADGAFSNADYIIEDLVIPKGPFEVTLQDLDERLIDHVGDDRKLPFAGAWDGHTARSMERIQLIFNNRGNRDSAWHTYSLNDFDSGRRGGWHQELRQYLNPDFAERTMATPGMPNSPDYSGNTSSGSFE